MALEFPAEQRGGLAAACIASLLAAKKDEREVGRGVSVEGVCECYGPFEGEWFFSWLVFGRRGGCGGVGSGSGGGERSVSCRVLQR